MNVNTMHPADEGREAFQRGEALNTCPYPDNTVEAVEWEGGWMEAEEEEGDDEA